jgi:L-fuculose-phosphate aldolase
MDEAAARKAICHWGRHLYQRGLVSAFDGNLSLRIAAHRYLVTRSGICKGDLTPDDIVIADSDGRKLDGDGKVSSEFLTHLAAYAERNDVAAVVHAHPPFATALTLAGVSMADPVLPEVLMGLGPVPTAPYATPGTPEGAEVVRVLVAKHDAVLLDRHGALTCADTLDHACHLMEKLEHAAHVLWAARCLGPLPLLNDAQIARCLAARAAYAAAAPRQSQP